MGYRRNWDYDVDPGDDDSDPSIDDDEDARLESSQQLLEVYRKMDAHSGNEFMRKTVFCCLKQAAQNPKEYFSFWGSFRRNCGVFGQEVADNLNSIEEAYMKELAESRQHVFVDEYLTKEVLEVLIDLIIEKNPDLLEPYVVSKNVQFLGELLEFDDDEILLTQLAAWFSNCGMLRDGFKGIYGSLGDKFGTLRDLYGQFFNIPYQRMNKIWNAETNLFKTGILNMNSDRYYFDGHFFLHHTIDELVCYDELTHDVIERTLFPNALDTDLEYKDFDYKQEEITILENIFNKAIKDRRIGINGLLWGEPGTGKTELCMLLAKKNKWDIRVIGDVDMTSDDEKTRQERLFSLKIAQKLFSKTDKKIVLLFDEMEDLFKQEDTHAAFSKAFINRILEKTTVPILWTANSLRAIGSPAVLRRMTYAMEFEIPPYSARLKMWKKYSKQVGLKLKVKTMDDLAVDFDIVPALIANAANVAKMSGVKVEDIPKLIANLDTAMNMGESRNLDKQNQNEYLFDPTLSNADIDLDELASRIVATGNMNFSMCLYGPPGTGKSAFARHLAERLRMRVMFKRASDLLSMWVGESEKNIAIMFKTAKESERFLIMDEADSMLNDRSNAVRSWEVTQVNEMLTHMEFHPTPFVATTNLMENLDSASLRRFTFKVKFDFLRPDQIPLIFKFYFGQELPFFDSAADILTPGDFANVKKKIGFLGITDPEKIFEMLLEECAFKPEHTGQQVGFGVGTKKPIQTYKFEE